MVRKTARSSAVKASENIRKEPSRRTRRRKSSSSSDSNDEKILSPKKLQPTNRSERGSSGNESDTESRKPLKKRNRSMAANDAKNDDIDKTSHGTIVEQRDDDEEINEENVSKGKSKSISKSNNENVNPETENENVQVTDESPPNDVKDDIPPNDDESKNGMETSAIIDVNVSQSIVTEMMCDISTEIASEQTAETVLIERSQNNVSNVPQPDSEAGEKEHFCPVNRGDTALSSGDSLDNKSEILQDSCKERQSSEGERKEDTSKVTCSGRTRKIKLHRLSRDTNASINQAGKEEKKEENEPKKKITLKRPEIKHSFSDEVKPEETNNETESSPKEQLDGNEWTSSYDSSKDDQTEKPGEKLEKKKITLNRSTVENMSSSDRKDSTSLERSISHQGKSERRKSSSTDNIIIKKRRRRTTEDQKSASESEERPSKPKKPTKVVKLIRKLPEEPQEPLPPGEEPIKKYKWQPSETSQVVVDTISLDDLKEVCPNIELLNEEDVDLEIVIKEKTVEKVKRLTFTELEEEEMESIEAELNAEPEDVEIKENIIAMNRKISIVEDTASKLKPPPSPAKHPVSEVLFVTNLVRPFTVKQLRELLERTGKIREEGFWTDRIKSKCYVYYETAEEAESTRYALHGVHWPIGNGKKLVIDFATVEDMENAKNPPIPVPKKEKTPEKENKRPDIPEEKHDRRDIRTTKRDWDISKENDHRHRRSRSRSRERHERKHSHRSYTPEEYMKKRKHEEPPPPKAMDDLFMKTKATPSIYWQPLSPEEIAHKQQMRQFRLEQNKRRLEQIKSSSGRGGVRDRGGRDRNFRRR